MTKFKYFFSVASWEKALLIEQLMPPNFVLCNIMKRNKYEHE